jgi:MoaA/NifB/PqqE/SkfB family radical SAM enzyme
MAAPATHPPLPSELQIEVTGACNLACRMCLLRYRPKLGRKSGAMDFDTDALSTSYPDSSV